MGTTGKAGYDNNDWGTICHFSFRRKFHKTRTASALLPEVSKCFSHQQAKSSRIYFYTALIRQKMFVVRHTQEVALAEPFQPPKSCRAHLPPVFLSAIFFWQWSLDGALGERTLSRADSSAQQFRQQSTAKVLHYDLHSFKCTVIFRSQFIALQLYTGT